MTQSRNGQRGLSLVELMVALTIGLFLMAGAITVFGKTRDLYRTNEAAARLQDTARYALSALEGDLRMANHWGPMNRADIVTNAAAPGQSLDATLAPFQAVIDQCGANWVANLAAFVEGSDSSYGLACAAFGTSSSATSDTLTVRRASFDTIANAGLGATNGQLKLRASRVQGILFPGTTLPAGLAGPESETRALLVHGYYVSVDSDERAGTPSLRRKRLAFAAGAPVIQDQQVISGIEDLQFQFGVDNDNDLNADYYVDPNAAIGAAETIVAVRLWMLARAERAETGFTDDKAYQYANRAAFTPADGFRRLLVSKTVQLRNARR